MEALRKILIAFIVLTLFFETTGYIFCFVLARESIKNEAKLSKALFQIDKKLEVFVFSEEEMKSLDFIDKNEFLLDLKLYDIVYIAKKDDSFALYCYHDIKEESLLKVFYKMIDGKHQQKANGANTQNIKAFVFDWAEEQPHIFADFSLNFISERNKLSLLFLICDLPKPPPKKVCLY